MTDEQFAEFCSEHPDVFFEVTSEGELLVMPPNYPFTGLIHNQIQKQLNVWADADGRGVVNEAASGFVLPNGARRSPDVSWTLKSRILQLDAKELRRYWHLCPDFIIDVKSPTDRVRVLRAKMGEWIDSGAQLGWMVDPELRTIEIWRPGREPEVLI